MTPSAIPDGIARALSRVEAHVARRGRALAPARGPRAGTIDAVLDRCETALAKAPRRPRPVLRSLHQFASVGGTVMGRCIASAPNTLLASEIDPLSRLHLRAPMRPFIPTDLIPDVVLSPRPQPADLELRLFRATLGDLWADLEARGQRLVLRDHAHSQFCTDVDPDSRPTLAEILSGIGPHLGAVLVRHPLDSYLSLVKSGWVHFRPGTLDEYARRYLAFLDRHADMPLFRYEDFVADPAAVTAAICAVLDLPEPDDPERLGALFRLSGGSGRAGGTIAPRPRRTPTVDITEAAAESARYAALCARLGYDPD